MSRETETILVIRCQLGDAEAWEELIQLWHPRLCGFVFRMISDRSVSEDVVQNIWIRVIRSFGRLKDPSKARAWMYQIARNTVADRLRFEYRQPFQDSLDDSAEDTGEFAQLELSDQLDVGLEALHAADREVLVLHYLEERSIEEISKVCRIPQGTVKSRLFRARKQLREVMKNEQ